MKNPEINNVEMEVSDCILRNYLASKKFFFKKKTQPDFLDFLEDEVSAKKQNEVMLVYF